ncbi:MAG: Vi polysaccharide biosynthesis UDP-N-acetylglucosamine C-6 dehydrogenase TviB [Proteobacteria bacterium]|nr:Vi polysaccharide biosynthesis UDP-N-acetylglucosamine C-6 dehydrogenase TviB [Pseudomonadota bacterium]
MLELAQVRLGVIGLGYVGLPLAAAFGRRFPTWGYDRRADRVAEIRAGHDSSLEVTEQELAAAEQLKVTADVQDLADCNVYIVAVPTPVDDHKIPDMELLRAASATVGGLLARGDLVIFESTVYPGCTEEVCVPVLEKQSGLVFNRDFFVGYSPERINPGDKKHRLADIVKVTSGSTPAAATLVDEIYRTIVKAGTHRASSLRVAEAAKVIENTQRDVNIALINELAILFNRLGIDTVEVLEAAGSKWNFLPFRPGLVGGHCIGVDPFYLTYKAQQVGHRPELILAGRHINDNMGHYITHRVIKMMSQREIQPVQARVLVLGFTFKENCPDIRNTRVIDIVNEFREYHAQVEVYDPWVEAEEARREYGLELVTELREGRYDAIVLAVAHQQFVALGAERIRALGKARCVLFDVKSVLPASAVDARL